MYRRQFAVDRCLEMRELDVISLSSHTGTNTHRLWRLRGCKSLPAYCVVSFLAFASQVDWTPGTSKLR